jgi:hypothetical protein
MFMTLAQPWYAKPWYATLDLIVTSGQVKKVAIEILPSGAGGTPTIREGL